MSFCQRHSPSPLRRSGVGIGGASGEVKRKYDSQTPGANSRVMNSNGKQLLASAGGGGGGSTTGFTSPFAMASQFGEQQVYSGFSPVRNSRIANPHTLAAANSVQLNSAYQQQQQSVGQPQQYVEQSPPAGTRQQQYFQQYVSPEGISKKAQEIDQDRLRHEIEAREHELKLLAQMDYLIGLIKDLDEELLQNKANQERVDEIERLKSSYATLHDDLQHAASENPNEDQAKELLAQAESITASVKEQQFQSRVQEEQSQQESRQIVKEGESVLTDSVNLNRVPAINNQEDELETDLQPEILKQSIEKQKLRESQQQSSQVVDVEVNPLNFASQHPTNSQKDQQELHQEEQQPPTIRQSTSILSSQHRGPSKTNGETTTIGAKEAILLDELKLKDKVIEKLQSELVEEVRQRESSVASEQAARREQPAAWGEIVQSNSMLRGEVEELKDSNDQLKKRLALLEAELAYQQKEKDLSSKTVLNLLSAKDDMINRLERQLLDEKKLQQSQPASLIMEQDVYRLREELLLKEVEGRQRETQLATAIERNDTVIRSLQASLKEARLEKELIIQQSDATFSSQLADLANKQEIIANLDDQLQSLFAQLQQQQQQQTSSGSADASELEELKRELSSVKDALDAKNRESEEVGALVKALQATIVSKDGVIDSLQVSLEIQTQNQSSKLEEANANVARLENEAEQLRVDMARLCEDSEGLRAQVQGSTDAASEQVERLSAELKEKCDAVEQMKEVVERQQEDAIQAGVVITNLEKELIHAKQDLEKVAAKKDAEIKAMKAKFKDALEDEQIKGEFTKSMNEQLAITIAEKEEKLAALEEEVEAINDAKYALSNELDRVAEELRAENEKNKEVWKEEYDQLAEQMKQMEQKDELAQKIIEKVRLAADAKSKEDGIEIEALVHANRELVEKRNEDAAVIQRLEGELAAVRAEGGLNEGQLRELIAENQALKQAVQDAAESAEEARVVEEKARETQKEEMAGLEEQLRRAVEEKNAVKAEYDEITASLVEMEAGVLAMQNQFIESKKEQIKLSQETLELKNQLANQVTEEQIQQSILELKKELNLSERAAPVYESHRSHSHRSMQGSQRLNSEAQPSEYQDEVGGLEGDGNEGQQQHAEQVNNIDDQEEEEDCSNCNMCLLEEMTRQNELLKQQLLFKEREIIDLRVVAPHSASAIQMQQSPFKQSMLLLHQMPISGGQGQVYMEANDSISQSRPINTSFYESPIRNQKQLQSTFPANSSFASPNGGLNLQPQQQQQFIRGSSASGQKPQQQSFVQEQSPLVQKNQSYSVLQSEIDHLQKIFESKCKEVDSWKKTYNQLKNNQP